MLITKGSVGYAGMDGNILSTLGSEMLVTCPSS